MKKVILFAAMLFAVQASFSQLTIPQRLTGNTSLIYSDKSSSTVTMSECDNCIKIDATDWYKKIYITNQDGIVLSEFSTKKLANKLQSNIIFICFDEWSDGVYTIILADGKRESFVELNKFFNDQASSN